MDEKERRALEEIAAACSGDQACATDCLVLPELGELAPGDVARQVLNGQIDEKVRRYITRCALCGLCTQHCPSSLDIPGMVTAARHLLLKSGQTAPEVYRLMWVDHDWNAVTLYRDTYQIDYRDLIKPRCGTLFLSSCFLANTAPELLRSAFGWLAGHDSQEVGLSLMCCGLPLAQIGLAERAERYTGLFWKTVSDSGARRIVTACPSCHYHLLASQAGRGVEVVSLFKLMADAGVRAPNPGTGRVTVHDSCPDRGGELGRWTRRLLADYEMVEMAHHGANTICCGSGGIVSAVDRELCRRRTERRVTEFQDTGADICVAYCMSCCNTLLRVAGPGRVRHVLELVFNQFVDYTRYADRLKAMWDGEWGDYNGYRLDNSRLMEALTNNVFT